MSVGEILKKILKPISYRKKIAVNVATKIFQFKVKMTKRILGLSLLALLSFLSVHGAPSMEDTKQNDMLAEDR